MSTICHLVFWLEYVFYLLFVSFPALPYLLYLMMLTSQQPILHFSLLQRNPDTLPSYIACRPAIAHSIVSIVSRSRPQNTERKQDENEGRSIELCQRERGKERDRRGESECCFTLPFRDTHLAFTRCPGGISMPGFCLHCLCVCQYLGFLLCLLSFFSISKLTFTVSLVLSPLISVIFGHTI